MEDYQHHHHHSPSENISHGRLSTSSPSFTIRKYQPWKIINIITIIHHQKISAMEDYQHHHHHSPSENISHGRLSTSSPSFTIRKYQPWKVINIITIIHHQKISAMEDYQHHHHHSPSENISHGRLSTSSPSFTIRKYQPWKIINIITIIHHQKISAMEDYQHHHHHSPSENISHGRLSTSSSTSPSPNKTPSRPSGHMMPAGSAACRWFCASLARHRCKALERGCTKQ